MAVHGIGERARACCEQAPRRTTRLEFITLHLEIRLSSLRRSWATCPHERTSCPPFASWHLRDSFRTETSRPSRTDWNIACVREPSRSPDTNSSTQPLFRWIGSGTSSVGTAPTCRSRSCPRRSCPGMRNKGNDSIISCGKVRTDEDDTSSNQATKERELTGQATLPRLEPLRARHISV